MYNLNGLLILTFFDDDCLVFFVDDLNCLFHIILKIELEGLKCELYFCNFSKSEIDEVPVVCLGYLLAVEIHLVGHHHLEVILDLLNISRCQQVLYMGQDDKVIGSRILQGLVDSLETTDLRFFEVFEQQTPSYPCVLLVRVVCRALVSTSLFIDLLHLLVWGLVL